MFIMPFDGASLFFSPLWFNSCAEQPEGIYGSQISVNSSWRFKSPRMLSACGLTWNITSHFFLDVTPASFYTTRWYQPSVNVNRTSTVIVNYCSDFMSCKPLCCGANKGLTFVYRSSQYPWNSPSKEAILATCSTNSNCTSSNWPNQQKRLISYFTSNLTFFSSATWLWYATACYSNWFREWLVTCLTPINLSADSMLIYCQSNQYEQTSLKFGSQYKTFTLR